MLKGGGGGLIVKAKRLANAALIAFTYKGATTLLII
jgi:hypothetical protein